MTRKRVTIIFLFALAAIALVLCVILFGPFVRPLISATVIAIVFYPVHSKIQRRVRNQSLAALISTILVILIIIVPAILISLAISREIAGLINFLNEKTEESGGLSPYFMNLSERAKEWLSQYIDVSNFDVKGWLSGRLQQVSSFLLDEVRIVIGNVASFAINTVIALFALFFLFREGRLIRRRVATVIPLSHSQVEELFTGIEKTITATVYGGVVVALVQGGLTGLALWVFGIRSAVLWGVVASVFALIPVVGAAAVWVPAAIYLFAIGHTWQAIVLIAWGAGVVGTIDNILRPLLMSGQVSMHPLLVFLAIFGGVQVFGFLGLFIGPVVLAVSTAIFRMIWRETSEWRARWREEESIEKESDEKEALG
ncbi:MAG TPA: AI-2E family transporter [Blastocatellia bacterium]|jgi:predicted PurR-regulated permease PerM